MISFNYTLCQGRLLISNLVCCEIKFSFNNLRIFNSVRRKRVDKEIAIEIISSFKNRSDKRRGISKRCHIARDERTVAPLHTAGISDMSKGN